MTEHEKGSPQFLHPAASPLLEAQQPFQRVKALSAVSTRVRPVKQNNLPDNGFGGRH